MNLNLGQTLLVKEIHTKAGFERQAPRGLFRAQKDTLSVVLYLGSVDATTLPQFSPNAAVASIGYGPLLLSRTQLSLLDVIDQLSRRLSSQDEISEEDAALIQLAGDAKAACAAFVEVAKKASP